MPARKHLPVCFVLAALLTSGFAAPSERVHKRTISDASQVSGKKFDHVIAGGGLGGSVLASRLSEDSTKTVLLIEAGSDQESNVDVSSTAVADNGGFNTPPPTSLAGPLHPSGNPNQTWWE